MPRLRFSALAIPQRGCQCRFDVNFTYRDKVDLIGTAQHGAHTFFKMIPPGRHNETRRRGCFDRFACGAGRCFCERQGERRGAALAVVPRIFGRRRPVVADTICADKFLPLPMAGRATSIISRSTARPMAKTLVLRPHDRKLDRDTVLIRSATQQHQHRQIRQMRAPIARKPLRHGAMRRAMIHARACALKKRQGRFPRVCPSKSCSAPYPPHDETTRCNSPANLTESH